MGGDSLFEEGGDGRVAREDPRVFGGDSVGALQAGGLGGELGGLGGFRGAGGRGGLGLGRRLLGLLRGRGLGAPGPAVFEGDSAVEDEVARPGVEIDAEEARALELEELAGSSGGQARLDLGAHRDERCGVELGLEGGVARARLLDREEAVVEADLGLDGVGGGDPVDGAFDLAARPSPSPREVGS